MEMDNEVKNKIDGYANLIASALLDEGNLFINIQIEEEYSQYDILFSYNFENLGTHQRGIRKNDLLIGIIGKGCYGFNITIPDTDPSYYAEKLNIHSNFLSFLFNEIRKKLCKKS